MGSAFCKQLGQNIKSTDFNENPYMSSDKLNMPKNLGLLKAKKQEKTLKLLLKQLDIKLENNIYCCCGRTEYLSKSREFHKCSKLSNSSKLILKVGLLPSKKVFFYLLQ